ncbi:MAG: glutaredoxin family protein [Actinobacteria bacterium]|nr:glutaredoxin family protein [Actinomycetota bacterium]
MEHVEGTKKGEVVLYALSTCQWCRKTRGLLDSIKVDYYYVYVDLIAGKDQEKIIEEIKRFNPACSFPTLVIDGKDTIVGFDEEKIRERLK